MAQKLASIADYWLLTLIPHGPILHLNAEIDTTQNRDIVKSISVYHMRSSIEGKTRLESDAYTFAWTWMDTVIHAAKIAEVFTNLI